MTKIFVHVPDNTACSYYRCVLPVTHCYHELSLKDIKLVADFQPLDGELFDVYFFNRVIKPDFWQYIQQLIQMGKKVVWQTDDDLWNVPTWNPAFYKITRLDINILSEVVQRANSLVFSTDYLADAIGRKENTFVLPNLIDCTDFMPYHERNNKPLKILWTGSYTHDEDLKQIIDTVYKVIDKYSDVQFIFWGYYPPDLFEQVDDSFLKRYEPKYRDRVAFLNWIEGRAYFDILDKLKPDIALGPLADCHFNKCKSSLKSLEMIMAGTAFIGSRLTPYEWIQHGTTGLLVHDSNGWFDWICYLIDHPQMRKQMVLKGQERIRESFSWQSSAKGIWQNAFEAF